MEEKRRENDGKVANEMKQERIQSTRVYLMVESKRNVPSSTGLRQDGSVDRIFISCAL